MPLRRPKIPVPKPARGAFKRRLILAMELAGMNIADLQHWFEREYVTVYSWVHHDKVPRPCFRTDDLMARMRLLEKTIASRVDGFPIPVSLSQRDRAPHVRGMYKNAIARIARSTLRKR